MSYFDIFRKKLNELDRKKLVDDYIVPGIKTEIEQVIKEKLKEVEEQLGYRARSGTYDFLFNPFNTTYRGAPRFSVNERINALAEYIGVKFDKTAAEPARVIAAKPKKKGKKDLSDEPVVYHKKYMTARIK